jgi:hypothetical protein
MILLGAPTKDVQVKALGTSAGLLDGKLARIELLGSEQKVRWSVNAQALSIVAPQKSPREEAVVFKLLLEGKGKNG